MERLYYLSHVLFRRRVSVLHRPLLLFIRLLYQFFVPYQTVIGPGASFGYRQCIVTARRARSDASAVLVDDEPDDTTVVGNLEWVVRERDFGTLPVTR